VRLADARRVPLFVASGRDSQKYPPEQVCDNLRLFHVAGMDVALRQYPCGHELMPLMLADMDRWIMEQVTGVSRSTSVWADCN
jgi:phospholipase/carboxylesterase